MNFWAVLSESVSFLGACFGGGGVSDPVNSFRDGEAFSAIFSFILSIKRYFVSFSSDNTASVAFFLASLCFLRYLPKKPDGS